MLQLNSLYSYSLLVIFLMWHIYHLIYNHSTHKIDDLVVGVTVVISVCCFCWMLDLHKTASKIYRLISLFRCLNIVVEYKYNIWKAHDKFMPSNKIWFRSLKNHHTPEYCSFSFIFISCVILLVFYSFSRYIFFFFRKVNFIHARK